MLPRYLVRPSPRAGPGAPDSSHRRGGSLCLPHLYYSIKFGAASRLVKRILFPTSHPLTPYIKCSRHRKDEAISVSQIRDGQNRLYWLSRTTMERCKGEELS